MPYRREPDLGPGPALPSGAGRVTLFPSSVRSGDTGGAYPDSPGIQMYAKMPARPGSDRDCRGLRPAGAA